MKPEIIEIPDGKTGSPWPAILGGGLAAGVGLGLAVAVWQVAAGLSLALAAMGLGSGLSMVLRGLAILVYHARLGEAEVIRAEAQAQVAMLEARRGVRMLAGPEGQ